MNTKALTLYFLLLFPALQGFSQLMSGPRKLFSLHLSPCYSNSWANAYAGGELKLEDRNLHEKFKIAFSYGGAITYRCTKNVYATTGLYYTNPGERDVRDVTVYPDSLTTGTVHSRTTWSYKYIGVPLQLSYHFIPPRTKKWVMFISGTTCIEKLVRATRRVRETDESGAVTIYKVKEKKGVGGTFGPFAIAGMAGAGIEHYIFHRRAQICLMPYYKFYFTRVFPENSAPTNSRLYAYGLDISLRWSLNVRAIK